MMTKDFINNLIKVINKSNYINWYNDNGFTFDIKNKKLLENDLNKYNVTTGKFNSFLRQISLYHFTNISDKKNDKKIYINKFSKFNSKFNGKISRLKSKISKIEIKEIIKLNLQKLNDKDLSKKQNDLKKINKILEMEHKILIREKEAIEFNNSLKEMEIKILKKEKNLLIRENEILKKEKSELEKKVCDINLKKRKLSDLEDIDYNDYSSGTFFENLMSLS